MKEALQFVIDNGNEYAKAYAEEALRMLTDDEIKTQLMYVLGNFSHCRADGAKEARMAMKRYILD